MGIMASQNHAIASLLIHLQTHTHIFHQARHKNFITAHICEKFKNKMFLFKKKNVLHASLISYDALYLHIP